MLWQIIPKFFLFYCFSSHSVIAHSRATKTIAVQKLKTQSGLQSRILYRILDSFLQFYLLAYSKSSQLTQIECDVGFSK